MEECTLRIFENKTLRRIIVPKRDEKGSAEGSTMINLHSFYHSPIYSIRLYIRLRWAGHVTRMKEGRNAFKILTCKPMKE